jgi:L-serine/L-threonine ammonia-lyase
LKLDVVQPSGSFKIRGISNCCWKAVHERGCKRLVSASGGNAGLAVAYSGKRLHVPVVVVVPESTAPFIRKKISDLGANVMVHGKTFDEANEKALELAKEADSVYIHPFDHPDIWEGHATIIQEIYQSYKEQAESESAFQKKPDAIITVVGAGGLLCGILQGLHKVGWDDVPVIASETQGAHSFAEAVKEGKVVKLPSITSIAKTLGAQRVCEEVFNWTKKHPITSVIVTDEMAVDALVRFADDHRYLVEPSCGAGLAVLYQGLPELQEILKGKENPNVVMIVCGGSGVTFQAIRDWQNAFNNNNRATQQ